MGARGSAARTAKNNSPASTSPHIECAKEQGDSASATTPAEPVYVFDRSRVFENNERDSALPVDMLLKFDKAVEHAIEAQSRIRGGDEGQHILLFVPQVQKGKAQAGKRRVFLCKQNALAFIAANDIRYVMHALIGPMMCEEDAF